MDTVCVRQEWLRQVTAHLQRCIASSALQGSVDGALIEALQSITSPANRIEELVLGGLITELAAGGRCTTPEQGMDRVTRLLPATVTRAGVPLARRAAMMLRDRHAAQLDVPALARRLASDETRLRRCFRAEYRITLREYHLRARVAAAVEMMAGGIVKAGALASLVGYSSEKNFYRAFRRFTRRTPAEVRRLSPAQLYALAAGILPAPRGLRPAHCGPRP